MSKEYLDCEFIIETKDISEDGTFGGYASVFGGEPDSYRDVVKRGAFMETLSKGGRNGFGVAMLWQHDAKQPIGVWKRIEENNKGLQVEGQLTKGVKQADEAHLLMKAGALKGLSFGYDVPADGAEQDEKKRIRYLKKVDLWEISPVTFPANTRSTITNVKFINQQIEEATTERELERILRDAGLPIEASKTVVSMAKPYLRWKREAVTGGELLEFLKSINAELKIKL